MRVLVLHGCGGNAAWQRRSNERLQRLIAPLGVELVHVDGPVLLPGSPWDPLQQRRDWLQPVCRNCFDGAYVYGGWAETIAYLAGVFDREGPFDGLLGHSMGAACAAAVAAMRHRGAFPHGIRFAVFVCGFLPEEADMLDYFPPEGERIALPTLHICGRADRTTPPETMAALASKFARPRVVHHTGGHYLAMEANVCRAALSFLRSLVRDSAALARVASSRCCAGCSAWGSGAGGGWAGARRWYCKRCWSRWAAYLPLEDEESGDEDLTWLSEESWEEEPPDPKLQLGLHAAILAWDESLAAAARALLPARRCEMCGLLAEEAFGGAHRGLWYCGACWRLWHAHYEDVSPGGAQHPPDASGEDRARHPPARHPPDHQRAPEDGERGLDGRPGAA